MLLSSLMRTVAITGRTDSIDTKRVNAFFGGRQGGRWAQQTVAGAFPKAVPGARAAGSQQDLADLHRRGAITDAEYARLRGSATA